MWEQNRRSLMKAGALVGLVSVGAFTVTGESAAQAAREITFAVPVTAIPVSTGPYSSLPNSLGFWEEEGLDVNVIPVAGSSLALQMVMTGQADFAGAGLPAYLAARAQTDDISAYYCVYARNQFQIITLPDSPISTLQDMEGKKFAVASLASAAVPYAQAALRDAGVDPGNVELLAVSGSPSAIANVMTSGTVDGAAVYDAITGGMEAIVGDKLKIIETPYDDKLRCGLVVVGRADFVENNPDVAAGVARGIAKATAFADANPEAAIRTHWETYPETKPGGDEADAMEAALGELRARLATMRVDTSSGAKWGDVSPEAFEAYEQFLADSGELDRVMPAEEVFDASLIDRINDWDEAAVRQRAEEMSAK